MRLDTDDYRQILLSNAPLLDLRAPVEFSQGSFNNTVNLPLMNDDERNLVGCCYKKSGQQAAIDLGHQLVSGAILEERLAAWEKFALENPQQGYMFCFRGGLRSRTVQSWLAQKNIHFPLIKGGYKALRRFLIDETKRLAQQLPIYIVSGLTGSDKTGLINSLTNSIDLEGLANHKGSSFGKQLTPQPSQINFENSFAQQLIKQEADGCLRIILEDESRLIGTCAIPFEFFDAMKQAPVIILQESLENRVAIIHRDYVIAMFNAFYARNPSDAWQKFCDYLLTSISKIKKRLGGEVYAALRNEMLEALEQQKTKQDFTHHTVWIKHLLQRYYDPMYEYQLSKKKERVIFSGNRQQVKDFINSLSYTRSTSRCRFQSLARKFEYQK